MNKKKSMTRSIAVIGVGNPLRRDDGIGIVLLHHIKEKKEIFTQILTFVDGGIGGMNLLHLFNKFDVIIVLDAVDFNGPAGETRFFSIEDISSKKQVSTVSTHNEDLFKVITLSKQIDACPKEIFVFGVQPQDVSFGQGLSDSIKKRFDVITYNMERHILHVLKNQ